MYRARSSSGNQVPDNGLKGWVKWRRCNCEPMKFFDARVSMLRNNPGRPFYKCTGCGEFDWVHDDELLGFEDDEINHGNAAAIAAIVVQVKQLKGSIKSLTRTINLLFKLVILLIVMLLICVVMK